MKHASTLRVLSLDTRETPNRSSRREVSLKSLVKLESLFTSLAILRGVDWLQHYTLGRPDEFLASALPASVRRLHLTDCYGNHALVENLWGIHAALERGELKRLTEVAVDWSVQLGSQQVGISSLGAVWAEKEGLSLLLSPANSPRNEWS